MAANKTRSTDASVADYFAAIVDETRRGDCAVLVGLMESATGQPAKMWGTGIVGFGSYHYRYESGREGDAPLLGFSSRKGDISVYIGASALANEALLARLGRHRTGKGCLYLRRLDDIDVNVFRRLLAEAVARHGCRDD